MKWRYDYGRDPDKIRELLVTFDQESEVLLWMGGVEYPSSAYRAIAKQGRVWYRFEDGVDKWSVGEYNTPLAWQAAVNVGARAPVVWTPMHYVAYYGHMSERLGLSLFFERADELRRVRSGKG